MKRCPQAVLIAVIWRFVALSGILLLPFACTSLAGTAGDGWYHAPKKAFSCPIPLQHMRIADDCGPDYCRVLFSDEETQYKVDCFLKKSDAGYWENPEVEFESVGDEMLRRNFISIHPEWRSDIEVLYSEAMEREGKSIIFGVILFPATQATDEKETSPRTVYVDRVYGFAIFRCFHLLAVSLHDDSFDFMMGSALGKIEKALGGDGQIDQRAADEVVDYLKKALLAFISKIKVGQVDYSRYLRSAAEAGDACAVKQMLDAGADANARDEKGTTPLMKAAAKNATGVVSMLLAAGAEVDAKEVGTEYVGWTALMYAAEWGHSAVVRILLDAGANPRLEGHISQGDERPFTALGMAASKGFAETVRVLLERGVAVDPWALLLPAVFGHGEVIRVMLQSGVGINTRGAAGKTLLIVAASEGHAEIVRLLTDAGADISIRDQHDMTALQHAQAKGHSEVIELLASYDKQAKKAYKVGDAGPAGGIVFYDKGSFIGGWRYLEAAPADLGPIQWAAGKSTHVETGAAVGSGKANTAAIVAAKGEGKYAAKLCQDLVSGGFADWFLPSKDELDLMYKNLHKLGLGGFAPVSYWSSSQYSRSNAWDQIFTGGYQTNPLKIHAYSVRAIREF